MQFLFILLIFFMGSGHVLAMTPPPLLERPYDAPDARQTLIDLFEFPLNTPDSVINQKIVELEKKPETLPAMILYPLSHIALDAGDIERAGFLFYLGQMRLRLELSICVENRDEFLGLRQTFNSIYGPRINTVLFSNPETLKKVVHGVIYFDKTHEHILPPVCKGVDRWEQARKENRDAYLEEFLLILPRIGIKNSSGSQ